MSFKEIMPGLTQIDILIPRAGFERFLSTWLLRDQERGETILVETGPASSIPTLLDDLRRLGAEKLDYLLCTHIHLDHSGGVGQFHAAFPHTKVIAPPGGRAHLIAPQRLYQASVEALGASLVGDYGEPCPLPSDAFADGLPDGLTVINTPGHAPFHDSYLYNLGCERILFPGEAAGFFYKLADGGVFQRPATPHKFYYDTALASLDSLIALGAADLICYPHYGCARGEDAKMALINARNQLRLWKDVITGLAPATPPEKIFAALLERDALLRNIEKLDKLDAQREKFFITQSIRGFVGYVGREAGSRSEE